MARIPFAIWNLNSTRTMGHAALRDQKIGNALRTIDTWYPRYTEHGRPLPVEPNGASLEAQEFFRGVKPQNLRL